MKRWMSMAAGSVVAVALVLGCVAGADREAFGQEDQVQRGRPGTVYLRRDVLGHRKAVPVSLFTFSFNGSELGVTGRILPPVDTGTGYVVVVQPKREVWVPEENVLLISYGLD